jgi:hypothetical protein
MAARIRLSLFVRQAFVASSAMPKKKRRRSRVERLIRTAEVRSVTFYLSAAIADANGPEPSRSSTSSLQVRCVMAEPVKGSPDLRISVYEATHDRMGTARPAVVGYVFGTKPDVHVVVTVEPTLFERTWALALAGNLKHIWISMTPPKWGRADVPDISFSNEPIE